MASCIHGVPGGCAACEEWGRQFVLGLTRGPDPVVVRQAEAPPRPKLARQRRSKLDTETVMLRSNVEFWRRLAREATTDAERERCQGNAARAEELLGGGAKAVIRRLIARLRARYGGGCR